MLEFQRMQGDAKDYKYAYAGGDGTTGGPDPGRLLIEQGTCRQELWPDIERSAGYVGTSADRRRRQTHAAGDASSDFSRRRAQGAQRRLSGACFHEYRGRRFPTSAATGCSTPPKLLSGQHGRHAMLMVGYTGNFYIIKNSWGTDWGDNGLLLRPEKSAGSVRSGTDRGIS